MIVPPQRAIVMPRVFAPDVFGPISVDTEILSLVTDQPGAIAIVGGPGSGKTTCIQHVATLFEHDDQICCVDDAPGNEIRSRTERQLVIYTAAQPYRLSHLAILELAPWTTDQILEYLTKQHPEHSGNLIQALLRWAALDEIGGNPGVLRVVIDRVASRQALSGRQAIVQHFQENVTPEQFTLIAALALFHRCGVVRNKRLVLTDQNDFGVVEPELIRLFEHSYVRHQLAVASVLEHLNKREVTHTLSQRFPIELVTDIAAEVKDKPELLEYLATLLDGSDLLVHAMTASILHAVSPWKPLQPKQAIALTYAQLPKAAWRELHAPALIIRAANLAGSDLSRSRFAEVNAEDAVLSHVDWSHAHVAHFNALNANFDHADFSHFTCERAYLSGASLRDADLGHAKMPEADLSRADLRGAILAKAKLHKANLVFAKLSGANLFMASLIRADLSGADLRETTLGMAAARKHAGR